MKEFYIANDQSVSDAISAIAALETNGRYRVVIEKTQRGRTSQQNRSLHLYLTMMSKAFNDAGIDHKMLMEKFKQEFSIPVTATFLKEVFRKIMSGMYGKQSTAKLTTTEMVKVYDVFNMGMGEKCGISRPWPRKEEKDNRCQQILK